MKYFSSVFYIIKYYKILFMAKKIEEKYKELSEREHIITRPGMWVGSVKEEEKTMFLYNSESELMETREIKYTPAMLKVVDEVISNSCDEFRRKDNLGLTDIWVTLSEDGWITVKDNGGIPVVKHKEAGVYVPEFIFGRLRTSSNYDDTEDRNVIGTNGVGGSLANVFSKEFIIDTCDKKHSFHRSWSNNMEFANDDLKIEKTDKHYTQTKFLLDYKRFDNQSCFNFDFIDIIEKRCIDAAAANLGLNVTFEYKSKTDPKKSKWKFKKFDEYINLYSNFVDIQEGITFTDNQKSVWVYPSGNINIGFVNGAECSKGTHVKAVRNEINTKILDFLEKKHKIELKSAVGVDNKYSMFIIIDVSNPAYNSQTKEELTNTPESFSREYGYINCPDKFLTSITKSEIINIVLDWYQQKSEAEDLAQIRKLNKEAGKKLLRSDKFINCTSRNREEKQLWIFEGDSAKAGFRVSRNPITQAAYIMRGVPLNTYGMGAVQVMKNQVFSDIINIMNLKWGEKNTKGTLNFNRIVISSDADADGHHIAGLLMQFCNHFPELFEEGIICRSISPIIIAEKGKDHRSYFTLKEYKKDEKNLKGYRIKYIKGLGTLEGSYYKDMMQNPHFQVYSKDELADSTFRHWLAKGIADERRNALKDEV